MTSSSEKFLPLDALMPIMRNHLAQGHTVTFMPRGISMLPMLRPGVDQVTLSPLPKRLRPDDLPLYQRDNGHYILHRIIRADSTYTCCGDNQYGMETGIRHDQMIGLVTAFTHKGRQVSVRHPLYRLYCLFWRYSRPLRYFCFRVQNKLCRLLRKQA